VLSGSNLLGLRHSSRDPPTALLVKNAGYGLPSLQKLPARLGRDDMTDQRTTTTHEQLVRDLVVEQLPPNPQWRAGYTTRSTTGVGAGKRAEREHRAQSAAQLPVGRSRQ
jgi:hypothetical protein